MGSAAILAKLLATTLLSIKEYKEARDRMVAAGEVTREDHSVMTDKELISLFRSDAKSLVANADDLITKYEGK